MSADTSTAADPPPALRFLSSGGEATRLILARDWSGHPLGEPETWPEALKVSLSLILNSPESMILAWGREELTFFFNTTYIPLLGPRVAWAMGAPFAEVWADAWDQAKPIIDAAFAGRPERFVDLPWTLDTDRGARDTWWSFSYSRVLDGDGEGAGLFIFTNETTARVQADAAAKESQDRLRHEMERQRLSLQQMPGFVGLLTGPNHVYDYVNDAYISISGPRDFIGRSVREVFPELEGQGFYELLDQVYATGEPFKANALPIALGGEDQARYLDLLYQPIRGEDGHVVGIFVGGHDVTEHVRGLAYRDALVRITDRIGDMQDAGAIGYTAAEIMGQTLGVSRVGYGTIDPETETLHVERDWNAPGVETLAGAVPLRDYGSFIDSLKLGEFMSIDDVDRDPRTSSPAAAGALKARSAASFVNVPVMEHGGLVAVMYVNHRAVRAWSSDELTFIQEAAARTRSAVERVRNQAALRELNATLEARIEAASAALRLYENIVQSDAAPVCAFDTEFRIIAFNKAHSDEFFRIYGQRVKIGDVFPDLFLPHQAQVIRGFMARALTGEVFTVTEEFGDPNLVVPYWEVSYNPLHDHDGRIIGAFQHAIDITSRLRAQAELAETQEVLRQSQKMEAVGQLTGGLAHDFNNLLAGISGSLELITVRLAQGRATEVDRYVAAAQGAAGRAAALTHRLLAFSRRQTLAPKPTDVKQLVAGMADLIGRTVGPQIRLETINAVGLWPSLIDPSQLENAILNLCINARDAMPEGGVITIETANRWLDQRTVQERGLEPGQYISLSVSDTGCGMTPDVVAKVFEPFFTTKPIGVGTGLGLSMIYGFAKQSGGVVSIYSEPGEGTNVCIYLPRHIGDADVADLAVELSSAPRGEGETVLVVDDEPTVRMLVSEVLADLGYTAIEAEDGATGLKVLNSRARVDLLVTDVGLPGGMNGRQVADAARAVRPDLKVLFITGYAENAVLSHGHLDPGMHVMTKPFAMEALATRIHELITGSA